MERNKYYEYHLKSMWCDWFKNWGLICTTALVAEDKQITRCFYIKIFVTGSVSMSFMEALERNTQMRFIVAPKDGETLELFTSDAGMINVITLFDGKW